MRKVIGVVLMVCLSNALIAQNLSNLDAKYGIKKFKLETSYENYKSNLELELDGKVKYYKYVGKDIQSVFGLRIRKIILGFYKNKLYYIGIELDDSIPIYPDFIYDELKKLFGDTEKLTNFKKGPFSYEWAYIWQTKKTYLCFDKLQATESENEKVSIWMISNVIDYQITSDDF